LYTLIGGSGNVAVNREGNMILSSGTTPNSYVTALWMARWFMNRNTENETTLGAAVPSYASDYQKLLIGIYRAAPVYYTDYVQGAGFWIVRDGTYAERLLAVLNTPTGPSVIDVGGLPSAGDVLRIVWRQDVVSYLKNNVQVAQIANVPGNWVGVASHTQGLVNTDTTDIRQEFTNIRAYQDY